MVPYRQAEHFHECLIREAFNLLDALLASHSGMQEEVRGLQERLDILEKEICKIGTGKEVH